MRRFFRMISSSIIRCEKQILFVLVMYISFCGVGIIMAHTGNAFALKYRDKIVGKAIVSDSASVNY